MLPKYSGNVSKCGSCGHDQVSTEYCINEISEKDPRGGVHKDNIGQEFRHLDRRCLNCGMRWAEGCLDDYQEPEPADDLTPEETVRVHVLRGENWQIKPLIDGLMKIGSYNITGIKGFFVDNITGNWRIDFCIYDTRPKSVPATLRCEGKPE